jgi:membrane-associated phospholipid phosphatase
MDSSPLWSLDWVRAVQSLGDWALTPMRVLTFLGQEFLVVLIPLLYWSINKSAGVDLSILLMGSSFFNFGFKAFFKQPRPFWLDATLQRASADSFSFPSGHAQSSAVVFGGLAYGAVRTPWRAVTRILAAIMLALLIALIALSRVYLGVHFPGDTLIGMLAGLAVLAGYVRAKPRLAPVLARLRLRTHILLALLSALAVLGIHSWGLIVQLATRPAAEELIIAGRLAAQHETGSLAGVVMGLWLGLAVESRYVRFTVAGTFSQRLLRYLGGGATSGLIFLALTALASLAPDGPAALSLGLLVIRYAITIFWAFAAWPWVFVRLRWAEVTSSIAPGAPCGTC